MTISLSSIVNTKSLKVSTISLFAIVAKQKKSAKVYDNPDFSVIVRLMADGSWQYRRSVSASIDDDGQKSWDLVWIPIFPDADDPFAIVDDKSLSAMYSRCRSNFFYSSIVAVDPQPYTFDRGIERYRSMLNNPYESSLADQYDPY